VRQQAKKKGHKLSFNWVVPRRITAVISTWVFEVENLFTRKKEHTHVRRMTLYRAKMDGKPVDSILLKYATHSETTYQMAVELKDIRENENGMELLVHWDGLPDDTDRTWEPLIQLYEDVPTMLKEFLSGPGKKTFKKRALALLKL